MSYFSWEGKGKTLNWKFEDGCSDNVHCTTAVLLSYSKNGTGLIWGDLLLLKLQWEAIVLRWCKKLS